MKNIKTYESFNEGEYDTFDNSSGNAFWGDQGAGVLTICTSTGKILIALRSQYVNEPGTWGIFGGMIDDKKEMSNPELAAKREMQEETGLTSDFKVIPAYVYKTDGFQYYNFIGLVDNEFKASLDWENEDSKWVTLDELKRISPKHFGLEALIKNSMNLIKKYAK
jgi:8-oxo-dGTP pyrophosphatase MutT (NUDIX family)